MAFNKVSNIDEAKEKYMAVTASQVLDMAQKYFVKDNLSEIIYL